MEKITEKPFDKSRSELLKILQSCPFSRVAKEICPLTLLRDNLSIERKYSYVKERSDNEVSNILAYHKKCYEKCFIELMQD